MVDSTIIGVLDAITTGVVVLILSIATLELAISETEIQGETIRAEVASVIGIEVGAQLYTVTVVTWATDDRVEEGGVEDEEAAAQPLAVSVTSTHFNWAGTGVVYRFHSVSDAGQA